MADVPWAETLLAAAALSAWAAYASGSEAAQLRAVRRLPSVADAWGADVLAALPLLVALRGAVGSDAPLGSDHAPNSEQRYAVVEHIAEQHFLKQQPATADWLRDSVIIAHVVREAASWFLHDAAGDAAADGGRVFVSLAAAGPAAAAAASNALQLVPLHDGFTDATPGVLRSSLDLFRGVKVLGTRTLERGLPLGTPITAVGQLARAEGGRLQLQRPPGGGPFVLSSKRLEEIAAEAGAAARHFATLSRWAAAAGALLLVRRAWMRFRDKRRLSQFRRQARDAAAAAAAAGAAVGADAAGGGAEASAEGGRCVVCLERMYDVVFVGCGHLVLCGTCAAAIDRCPVCRRASAKVKVYRA